MTVLFFSGHNFWVIIGGRIFTQAPITVLTYDRKILLPEKKGTVVWPAMFFGGFKLQPEKIMTRKKKVHSSGRRSKSMFLAGSNYNRKQL